jgi:hypothetical protein
LIESNESGEVHLPPILMHNVANNKGDLKMIKKLTIILTVFLTITILTTNIFAGGGRRNGTAGAQELLIPVSARGLAMSGAYVSGISGLDAIFYNPAGFGGSFSDAEAMFSYMNYIADIGFSFAAVGVNLGDLGSIAFNVRSLDFGDIPVTTVDNPYGDGTSFSPSFFVGGVTYSNSLTDRIRVGVNFNLISENIVRTSATGFSFDAGIQYTGLAGVEGLSMGVVLKNLGSQLKYDGEDLLRVAEDPNGLRGPQFYSIDAASFELPSQLEFGVSYFHRFDETYKAIIASSFQNNNFSNDEYKIAGEFNYDDLFFIRGGYTYVTENVDDTNQSIWGPTFGVGLALDIGINVQVDYAFRSVDYFDANHMFTVKLGF